MVTITKQTCCRSLCAAIMLLLLGMVVSCGRKAPPRPPDPVFMPEIENLSAEMEDEGVVVNWTLATNSTDISGFRVYRAHREIDMAECRSCPLNYELVGEVDYGNGRRIPEKWFFRDSPPPGFAYYYIVRSFSDTGLPGPAPGAVRIILEGNENSGIDQVE